MTCNKIVIISESGVLRESLEKFVLQAGFDAETESSLGKWLLSPGAESARILVLDTIVGDLREPEQVAMFHTACSSRSVLVLTQVGDIPTAVQAIRQGAVEVIQKPVKQVEFLEGITRMVATTF